MQKAQISEPTTTSVRQVPISIQAIKSLPFTYHYKQVLMARLPMPVIISDFKDQLLNLQNSQQRYVIKTLNFNLLHSLSS